MFTQVVNIPFHGLVNAGIDFMSRCIAQQFLCLADISLGMAYISGTKITVNWFALPYLRPDFTNTLEDHFVQLVECGAITERKAR